MVHLGIRLLRPRTRGEPGPAAAALPPKASRSPAPRPGLESRPPSRAAPRHAARICTSARREHMPTYRSHAWIRPGAQNLVRLGALYPGLGPRVGEASRVPTVASDRALGALRTSHCSSLRPSRTPCLLQTLPREVSSHWDGEPAFDISPNGSYRAQLVYRALYLELVLYRYTTKHAMACRVEA